MLHLSSSCKIEEPGSSSRRRRGRPRGRKWHEVKRAHKPLWANLRLLLSVKITIHENAIGIHAHSSNNSMTHRAANVDDSNYKYSYQTQTTDNSAACACDAEGTRTQHATKPVVTVSDFQDNRHLFALLLYRCGRSLRRAKKQRRTIPPSLQHSIIVVTTMFVSCKMARLGWTRQASTHQERQ